MILNEKFYHHVTEMGLNVFFVKKEGYQKQHAIFSVNYGSTDNKFISSDYKKVLDMPEGIAHFLEHKLFEDPKKDIFDFYSSLGADSNAFTSFNNTAYLFTSTSNFYECLEELIRFVQDPYFTDESVEKEKGIIEQEIKMYEDDPGWRVYFNSLNAMYKNHPVNIDIAGTVESINKINKDMLYGIYNVFYHPKNMGVFIVGDLDFDKIKETIDNIERKDYSKDWKIERIIEEPLGINEKLIETSMGTSNPLFYVGFKDEDLGYTGRDEVKKELVTDILLEMLFGSSSELYNQLYDDGLIDDNFGAYFSGKTDYGHSLIMGESERPKELYDIINRYIGQSQENVLKESNFKRIKNDAIGNYILGFNSIEFITSQLMESFFLGFDPRDYLDVLNEICFEDIENRYKEHLKDENMILSIVNPLE